ncbi:hypothetical protein V2J09_011059 [Rumex salicifolius]
MEHENAPSTLPDPAAVRAGLLRILCSRRSDQVSLRVEPAEPVNDPLYQDDPQFHNPEVMESAPKGSMENWKDFLVEENLYVYTEGAEQGRLPVLILSIKETHHGKKPAIVILHSTNKCKEWVRPLLEAYASRGYVAISIDSRYHGERAKSKTAYKEALVSSWKKGDTMPFIYDTAWDLIKLADYLTQRKDIDSGRIGITGESLGGMHAWFASAVDTRYAVVVPVIGIQSFRWAIENDKWQARVNSIKSVFDEARSDLGKSLIDREVVEKVWDRIAPGLASEFDSPFSVPVIAPRPLLILNGGEDPRCPVAGLECTRLKTEHAYERDGYPVNFKMVVEPGIGHQMTKLMVKEASDWFDKFLLPQPAFGAESSGNDGGGGGGGLRHPTKMSMAAVEAGPTVVDLSSTDGGDASGIVEGGQEDGTDISGKGWARANLGTS